MTDADIRTEALGIFECLISTSFEDCCPLSREFADLTVRPSIYAVKHRIEGILYIGKTKNTRERFRGGHKALLWAYLERLDPDDVRIAVAVLSYRQWSQLLLELETAILQASNPPYNVKIPMRD